LIIVHSIVKLVAARDESATATVRRQVLEPFDLQIPTGAIWIDLIEPTEDRKVQEFVGVPVPTKADPDYTGEDHKHAPTEIPPSRSACWDQCRQRIRCGFSV
jgi:hypothetical protein